MKLPLWLSLVLLTAALSFLFLGMSYAADFIPNEMVRNNIAASEEFLSEDAGFAMPNILFVKDLNSDAIMVGSLGVEDSVGVFHKTLTNPCLNPSLQKDYFGPHLQSLNYADYYNGDDNYTTEEYSRYWHGYKVTLKPLLIFLQYSQIRLLNYALLFSLALISIYLISRKINWQTGFLFAAALVMSGFSFVPDILLYSTSFYIMLCFTITILMVRSDKWSDKRIFLTFYCVGAITSFMELLATPIVTLGYPLAILYLCKANGFFENRIRFLIGCIICWGCGYLILWGVKWVLATLLCGDINVISDAFSQIIHWSRSPDIMGAVDFWTPTYVFFALLLIWLCASAIALRFGRAKTVAVQLWPLVLIASLPFLWVMAASSHSYYHYKFVWRIFGITVFALSIVWRRLLLLGHAETSSAGSGETGRRD